MRATFPTTSLSYRAYLIRSWDRRLVDLSAHIIVAWALPGPWWYQWLPDLFVPVLVCTSLVTRQFVPQEALVARLHQFLHSGWWVVLLALALLFNPLLLPLFMNWAVHLCIDLETHEL